MPAPRVRLTRENETEPLFGSLFVATYPPFSRWTAAALESYRQRLATRREVDPPLGLYVHVPFCAERCRYCHYLAYDDRASEIDAYLDALVRELARYAESPALAGRLPAFVYFGGGTPSLLSTPRLGSLLARLRAVLPWTAAREVSFECAPQSVTATKLETLIEAGVTRLSLGVQQLDDQVLEQSGRVHRVADVERAWAAIRRAGFAHVNVDLMVGLLGEDDASFFDSLDRAIGMAPDSVTLYQLELPFGTPLQRALAAGNPSTVPASWATKRRRLDLGFARLERAGYRLRSAYTAAQAGHEAFVYQDEQYRGADLLGLGVASFSYLGPLHQQNLTTLEGYLDAVGRGDWPHGRAYALADDERLIREFVLQLKLGLVELEPLREKFGVDPLDRFTEPLAHHALRGWLVVEPSAIRLTRAGLLCADRLLEAFYRPEHRGVRYS